MGAYNKVVLSETDNSIFNNVSNSTVSKEMEKFNNSYSTDKIKDIFDAYENVAVSEDALKENSIIRTNVVSNTVSNVSFKQKLFLIGATLICSIMLFLAVFNIFVINNTYKDINILQDNIVSEEKTYYDLYKDWSTATNSSGIESELANAGYSNVDSDQIISLEVGDLKDVKDLKGATNWFDSVCNFISSIFGR